MSKLYDYIKYKDNNGTIYEGYYNSNLTDEIINKNYIIGLSGSFTKKDVDELLKMHKEYENSPLPIINHYNLFGELI